MSLPQQLLLASLFFAVAAGINVDGTLDSLTDLVEHPYVALSIYNTVPTQNVKVGTDNVLTLIADTGSVFQVLAGSTDGVYKLKHVQSGAFVVGVTPMLQLASGKNLGYREEFQLSASGSGFSLTFQNGPVVPDTSDSHLTVQAQGLYSNLVFTLTAVDQNRTAIDVPAFTLVEFSISNSNGQVVDVFQTTPYYFVKVATGAYALQSTQGYYLSARPSLITDAIDITTPEKFALYSSATPGSFYVKSLYTGLFVCLDSATETVLSAFSEQPLIDTCTITASLLCGALPGVAPIPPTIMTELPTVDNLLVGIRNDINNGYLRRNNAQKSRLTTVADDSSSDIFSLQPLDGSKFALLHTLSSRYIAVSATGVTVTTSLSSDPAAAFTMTSVDSSWTIQSVQSSEYLIVDTSGTVTTSATQQTWTFLTFITYPTCGLCLYGCNCLDDTENNNFCSDGTGSESACRATADCPKNEVCVSGRGCLLDAQHNTCYGPTKRNLLVDLFEMRDRT